MKRGENGYMKVVAGVFDAPTPLPPSARRRLNDEERRTLVERLRRQGWSYRRISTELNISYRVVSHWLDGLPAESRPAESRVEPLPVAHLPPRRPLPPAVVAPREVPESLSPRIEQLLEQNHLLLQRVDALVVAGNQQRAAIAELEARLTANIEEQHQNLGERLLSAIKLLFGKIITP